MTAENQHYNLEARYDCSQKPICLMGEGIMPLKTAVEFFRGFGRLNSVIDNTIGRTVHIEKGSHAEQAVKLELEYMARGRRN
jgi:hypothetical protein